MTWFKVDDSFWSHPKTMALSPEAIALWVRSGSWSCQQLTDGFISDRTLPLFASSTFAVAELVECGFWEEVDGGHRFHDWEEYQESSGTVKERRAKARERMRAVRANRERTQHERAMEHRAKFAESSLNPDPTRPDPSSKEEETRSRAPSDAKKGSRVPPNFTITDEMRAWAAREVPLVNVDNKLAEWIDYWRGVPGQRGLKLDWVATWNNGMRKQQEFALRDNPAAAVTPKKKFVAHVD